MSNPKLVIVGGGLAGLSAGCYARVNDFDVTIVEHNLSLGGVCTAWQSRSLPRRRLHPLADGRSHSCGSTRSWASSRQSSARPLDRVRTYRHVRDGLERQHSPRPGGDGRRTVQDLLPRTPTRSIGLLRRRDHVAGAVSPVRSTHAPELTGLPERLRDLWQLRHELGTFAHFRKPVGKWIEEDLKSPRSRAVFRRLMPPETPTLFLADGARLSGARMAVATNRRHRAVPRRAHRHAIARSAARRSSNPRSKRSSSSMDARAACD